MPLAQTRGDDRGLSHGLRGLGENRPRSGSAALVLEQPLGLRWGNLSACEAPGTEWLSIREWRGIGSGGGSGCGLLPLPQGSTCVMKAGVVLAAVTLGPAPSGRAPWSREPGKLGFFASHTGAPNLCQEHPRVVLPGRQREAPFPSPDGSSQVLPPAWAPRDLEEKVGAPAMGRGRNGTWNRCLA